MTDVTWAIVELVKKEMVRQDEKWGADQNHDPSSWNLVLTEEVGETAKAILEDNPQQYVTELTHVAAVAIQAAASVVRVGYILQGQHPS